MTRARAERPARAPSSAAPPRSALAGRTDWLCLATVVLGAFAVRLVYLFQIRDVVFFQHLIVDAEAYDHWATRIAGGEWLGREVFYQAPLYPYFLALCQQIVGHDLWNIRVVQIALGALACAFLFLAARDFWQPRIGRRAARTVGVIAGALLAVYGPAVFFDGLIQKAVLDGFLGALLLALLARHANGGGPAAALAAGLTLGAFILSRENALLAAFVIIPWLLIPRGARSASASAAHARDKPPLRSTRTVLSVDTRLRLRDAALFTVAVAAPLLLVGVRNYAVGGEFILTTSQFGPNLYIGNHPGAPGVLEPLRPGRDGPRYERLDATELAEAALGRTLAPAEVSRYWTGRVLDYVTSQPRDWLALLGRKAALAVNAHEVADAEDIYYYELHSGLLRALLWCGHFGVLLPLAAAGMVLAGRPVERLGLLYGLLAAFAAGLLIFYVFGRYRYPLVPPLVLVAAFAVWRVAGVVRTRDWRMLRWPAVAALAAAVAANWPLRPRDLYLPAAYSNAGAALIEHGRLHEGLALLQQAAERRPDNPDIHLNLGRAHGRLNRMAESVAALRRAAALRPDDPLIESQLGIALAESGDLPGAAARLLSAWRRWPQNEENARNLLTVLRLTGRYADLAAVLRQRQQAAPHDRGRAAELAWTLATCPDAALRDGPLAVRLASAALDSNDPHALDILAAALAEAGRFDEAIRTAERALTAARQAGGGPEFVAAVTARRDLYLARRPFRE